MLTDERQQKILVFIEKNRNASVSELVSELGVSESTIRRDLTILGRKNLLLKVHGGAVAVSGKIQTIDQPTEERSLLNSEKKKSIASYAASLIKDSDTVYIDAGTSTLEVLSCISKDVSDKTIFFTNGINHARLLSRLGYRAYLPSGYLKDRTGAIIGEDACIYLSRLNFTKGFFGTNGASLKQGFTTPDPEEGAVKRLALQHCREAFVLCDSSKFNQISSFTFSSFDSAICITDKELPDLYRNLRNVHVCGD